MGAARFTVIAPECVRLEYSPSGRFVDAPTLLANNRTDGSAMRFAGPVAIDDRPIDTPEAAFAISTERFELSYRPHGRGFNGDSLHVAIRGRGDWRPGDAQTGNLGGTLSTLDGLRKAQPLPEGLLSRDGWYLLDDSRGHVLMDGWIRPRDTESGAIDWYLLAYGDDYRAALRAFTALSGPVPLPRRALLGSWYSRYWPHTSADFREIVEDYHRHGLPLDVMVLDMDWHREGWTGWSWNRELLPDAEDLLRWMHARGLAVTLNLHPADGVGPHEDRYADFMHAIGRDPSSGVTIPFDAGDRTYISALFERVHRPLEHAHGGGVDFWWVDWQQDKFVRSIPGLTNLQWLNKLYFDHTRTKQSEGEPRQRGVSFSRWAGDTVEHRWGDHRHPIHFSGDAHTGWEMLAFQVPFTVAAGNVGCFFWSHDIGGHFGPRIEEATARWVQFGALSAALRLHSARTGVLDRRPWTYAPRFLASMKAAMSLRAELMPHLYTEVRRSCRESVPLLRPMYLDYAARGRAYACDRQYMLGEHLLAAPIVEPGVGEACVATQLAWFPPSRMNEPLAAWRRWESGERFLGGDEAIVSAAIDEVPLFVREGVPIVLQSAEGPAVGTRSGMTGDLGEHARVRLWPPLDLAEPATFQMTLEEDDGITDDPSDDLVARTPMIASWTPQASGAVQLQLSIGPTTGSYAGQVALRRYTLELGGVRELKDARTQSGVRPGALKHDPHRLGGLLSIPLELQSLHAATQFVIEFVPTDADGLNVNHAARRFTQAFGVPLEPHVAGVAEALRSAAAALGQGPGSTAASHGDAPRVIAIGAGVGGAVVGSAFRICDTFEWVDDNRVEAEILDTIGSRSETHGRRALTLTSERSHASAMGRSKTADLPIPPGALRSPPLGLLATRVARCECSIDGHRLAWTSLIESRLTSIPAESWRVLGPFGWDWSKPITAQVFSPEQQGGYGLRDRDWHDARNGTWVTWSAAVAGDKWSMDFRKRFDASQGLAYATTCVLSSRRQRARLHVDSSDKIEIWVNHVKAYTQDGFDTQAALDGGAEIILRQGRCPVLVKCASGGGGWGFSLSIEGELEIAADAEPEHAEHRAAGLSFG